MLHHHRYYLAYWVGIFLFLCPIYIQQTMAEVVFDGSLGPNATGTTRSGTFVVNETDGVLGGENLFHSLSTFNVNTGERASFTHTTPGVQNIITRVTGDETSFINGQLSSDASLWLMNPNGLTFGSNALLNITGSFHATTADYLGFAEGKRFYANLGEDSVLSVVEPSAFGFLDNNIADVSVYQSQLLASEGNSLSLIGGNVTIESDSSIRIISAPSSHINIASVSSAGEVHVDTQGIEVSSADNGSITLLNSIVNTNGNEGDIFIAGGKLVVANSIIDNSADNGDIVIDVDHLTVNEGSTILASNHGTGEGGEISITAGTINIDAGDIITKDISGQGDSADIVIQSHDMNVYNGGRVQTKTKRLGTGNGGKIVIAADNIMIDGQGTKTSIETITEGYGAGGNIVIVANNVEVKNGGIIDTLANGSGNGGQIDMKIDGDLQIAGNNNYATAISTSSEGDANSGNIVIEATNIDLQGGGQILTTSENGRSGAIDITVDTLTAKGQDNIGSSIITRPFREGVGGDINLVANHINLLDQSTIFTGTITGQAGSVNIITDDLLMKAQNGAAAISASTSGTGSGGDVNITANNLELRQNATISADTSDNGDAGSIEITTTNLLVEGTSAIFNSTTGGRAIGTGGNITIKAQDIALFNGGVIAATTFNEGKAGNITLHADQLTLDTREGTSPFFTTITTQTQGSGDGGDIAIEAKNIHVLNNGFISAKTFNNGNSGSINLRVGNGLYLTNKAQITTGASDKSSGNAGDMNIQAGSILLKNKSTISSQNEGIGQAGRLLINSRGNIQLTQQSVITTETVNSSTSMEMPAINITATNLLLDNSEINARSAGKADAGDINISTLKTIQLANNSKITTESYQGGGGDISLITRDLLHIKDSEVTTSVAEGSGNGGNIFIDPEFVILDEGLIKANSNGGNGGNITLIAKHLLRSANSRIEASSNLGIDGNVTIDVSELDTLENNDLSAAILDQSQFLKRRCGKNAVNNSFVVTGQAIGAQPIGQYFSSKLISRTEDKAVAEIDDIKEGNIFASIDADVFKSVCHGYP